MNILIADDHAVVRQGYASLLDTVFDPCNIVEAESGEQALALFRNARPDLVIMDIGLPGISGVEAASRMLEQDPEARILFFSMYDEVAVVKQALAVGGMGYITKSGSPQTLINAVTRIAQGEIFIEYDLVMRVTTAPAESVDARLRELSQREFEVFVMLARGESNEEIGAKLDIERKTVANHVASIKRKLNMNSIAKMVFFAVDAGIVQIRNRPA